MRRGFTMIELVIMITIIVIVVGIILSEFVSLNSSQSLQGTAEVVKSNLERAQSLTLSSQGDTQYGVHFDTNQIVLFKGATYSAGDTNNIFTVFNGRVEVYSKTINGGGSEVLFDRLTGSTSDYGTTTLALISSTSTQIKIVVSASGEVNSQ